VSRDFEVCTNVSCEESTVSLRTGLIMLIVMLLTKMSQDFSTVCIIVQCCGLLHRVVHYTFILEYELDALTSLPHMFRRVC